MAPRHVQARPVTTRAARLVLAVSVALCSVAGMLATPAAAASAPSTPSVLSATPGPGRVTLAFGAPVSNGGASITSYTVGCTPRNGTEVTATVTMPAPLSAAVTGLADGVVHTCRVRASNGIVSPWSGSLSTTPRSAPPAPAITSAAPGNNQLTVTVSPQGTGGSPLTGYAVTCAGPGTVTVRATTATLVVRPLANLAQYSCTAQVSNVAGASSASSPATATPYDFVPVPTALVVTPASTSLRVAFSPGAANGSAKVVGYRTTCTPSTGAATTVVSTASPATVTGLVNGRSYSCAVRATTASAVSDPSAAVSSSPRTVPAAPTAVAATGSDSAAAVSWTASSTDGGSALTAYRATCRTTTAQFVGTADPSATSVSVTGLSNGVQYSCSVVAVNAAGTSVATSPVLVTPRTVASVPGTPVVVPRNQFVALAWTPPTALGGSPVTDFVLQSQSSTDGGTTWGDWATVVDTVSAVPSFTVPSLTNGTSYRFRVAATNAAGTSAYSPASLVAVPRTVPSAPTAATVAPADSSASVTFADPVSDGGAAVTSYTASCTLGSTVRTATGLPSLSGQSRTLVVTGLTNGRSHLCSVRATNVAGISAASSTVAVVPRTVATPPTVTSSVGGNTTATLVWTAPVFDGGDTVDSYTVSCTAAGATSTVTVTALTGTVTGLDNGTTYACSVTAANDAGSSRPSTAVSVVPRTVPSAPTGVTASLEHSRTTVAFTPVPRADNGGAPVTGYTAVCSAQDHDTATTSGVGSPLVVAGMDNGTEYSCSVFATNVVGPSENSTPVTVTPGTTPRTPGTPDTTPADESVALAWTAPTDDGGFAVTDYTVQYSSDGGATWTAFDHAADPATGTTVTGLDNGTTYRFRVAAVNARGASSFTRSSAPTTPRTVPTAPDAPTAVASDSTLALDWDVPSSDGGSAVTDYVVEHSVDDGATWTVVDDGVSTTSAATVTGLANGTSYLVRVAARNAAGTSVPSDPSDPSTPGTTPSAPRSPLAAPGDTEVLLTWSAPSSDGGAEVTDYAVQYSSDGGATWTAFDHAADPATGTTVTGLDNGTTYRFRIAAVNSWGTGPRTSALSSVVPRGAPSAPGAPTVTPGDSSLEVDFDLVTGAAANGALVTAYTVSCTSASGPASATVSTAPATVTGLVNGEEYSCTVVAHNAGGTSEVSDPATATPRTVPDAPTLDGLVPGPTTLEATVTTGVSDGGSEVTSTMVTCTDSDGVERQGTAPVTGSSTTVVVTGLVNGAIYSCTAVTTNAAGPSEPSDSSQAAPVDLPDAPSAGTVEPGDAELSVYFGAPVSDGGSPVTSYTVTCDDGTAPATASGTSSPVSVTGLTNGSTYSCTVVATTAVGTSAPSDPVESSPFTVPDAPVPTTASAASGTVTVDFTAPSSDGGATLTGYTLSCTGAGTTFETSGTASPLAVEGLVDGVAYACSVTATNAAGTSAPSATVTEVPFTVPSAPTSPTVVAGDQELQVSFAAPSGNGRAVTSYTVTCDDGDSAATATGTSSPLVVDGLVNGTSYTCSVTAANVAGTSPASASVSGRPATVPDAPTSVEVVREPTTATVSFAAPSDDGGSAVTGYTVGCSPVADGATVDPVVVGPTATSATVEGLTAGAGYVCWVTASNAVGPSTRA